MPADLVRNVVNGLVQNGKVVRGYLGVSIQNLNPALAESFDSPIHGGALVSDVKPDSPAGRAGVRSGDVITKVAGVSVTDAGRSSSWRSGETGARHPARAPAPAERRDQDRHGHGRDDAEPPPRRPARTECLLQPWRQQAPTTSGVLNGVQVGGPRRRRPRHAIRHPRRARIHGALITEVAPDSASARAGLEAGDVILEINHHAVANADEAVKLSEDGTKKKTLLKLWSHGGMIYTVVDETAPGNS